MARIFDLIVRRAARGLKMLTCGLPPSPDLRGGDRDRSQGAFIAKPRIRGTR
jgi:hypothetical protein